MGSNRKLIRIGTFIGVISLFLFSYQNCGQVNLEGEPSSYSGNVGIETKLNPVDSAVEAQGTHKVCVIQQQKGSSPILPTLEKRVLLCHVPHGNEQAAKTLLLPEAGAKAHMTHHRAHDYLGLCEGDEKSVSNGLQHNVMIMVETEDKQMHTMSLSEINVHCVNDQTQ